MTVRKFSDSHEWIEIEKSHAKVGITPYAQKKLGEIVYVELPKKAFHLKAGDVVAVLESTKAAVDIHSPVSGTILEVNESLRETTDLLNHAPDGVGWLYIIELEDIGEIESLMDESSYKLMTGQPL